MIYLISIACFIGGWYFRQWIAVLRIKHILEENDGKFPVIKKSKSDVPELMIKIEKHKDIFYVFENETDKFLTQGATRAECVEKLAKMYTEINIVADPNNVKEVGFK